MFRNRSRIRTGTVALALLIIGMICALSPAAQAERFSNSYIAFEMPFGWTCSLEETEWVCADAAQEKSQDAIIILTAKERGQEDRLDLYQDHLSTPRLVLDSEGRPTGRTSRIEFIREDVVGNHPWIHGRHYESEVPGYFTDYFATIKNGIAILVTFSAHRSVFIARYDSFYPSMATIEARSPAR